MMRAKQAVPPVEEMPACGDRGCLETQTTPVPAPNGKARTVETLMPKAHMSAPSLNGGDHASYEAQTSRVAATNGHGQTTREIRPAFAVAPDAEAPRQRLGTNSQMASRKTRKGRRGRTAHEAQSSIASPPSGVFSEIAHAGRQYWAVLESRKMLHNRIGALERAELVLAWREDWATLAKRMEKYERFWKNQLTRHAKRLPAPIVDWVKATPGIGLAGLGQLLSCTGPLTGGPCGPDCQPHHHRGHYPTVSALWAFLGMHVLDGGAPKRAKGRYANWSHRGRTVCFNIGEAIVKCKLGGPYREVYDCRRAEVLARPGIGPSACPFGRVHGVNEKEHDEETDWNRKTGRMKVAQCISDPRPHTHKVKLKSGEKRIVECSEAHSAHVHADARRVAVKAMLADLWGAWQKAYGA